VSVILPVYSSSIFITPFSSFAEGHKAMRIFSCAALPFVPLDNASKKRHHYRKIGGWKAARILITGFYD